MVASFVSGPDLGLAGKYERTAMIRKKWRDGEAVLSVDTEDEFWKAVSTGEPVELTHELAEKVGLMVEDVRTIPLSIITRRLSLETD